MKNKIIVISGFSASGKTDISNWIQTNTNYENIISTTTRPIRLNEIPCKDYFFVLKSDFKLMIEQNKMIEYRTYNTLVNNIPDTWYYGIEKANVDLAKNSYVAVLDIVGLKGFKEYFGEENIISIFIDVDEETRKQRCINRKDFDLSEWNRRYADDKEKFTEEVIKNECKYVIENYDFDECIEKIKEVIN